MRIAAAAALLLIAVGCATPRERASPQDRFFSSLSALCGKSFEGRIASPAAASDAAFAGKRLVMHVRDCSAREIRIPFHVGQDRSRTWVVTRTSSGLRLKHDHRHEDGSPDEVSNYGGDSRNVGTAVRQEFPSDQYSRDLFVHQNIKASIDNVWAMEVHPGRTFAYELRRPGRFFRVDFDLRRAVASPPPPWGSR